MKNQSNTNSKKAKRVVAEGFHATWSPDGSKLAYSSEILGFTGIEILNLETGKTDLLTVPGFDPAWSPDGSYIAFTRHRQHLLLADLTIERSPKWPFYEEREIWIMKADGTGEPELLVRGSWPHWGRDPKRVFYHSPIDNMICSIPIGGSSNPNPITSWKRDCFVVSPNEEYVAYGKLRRECEIVELSTNSIVARWRIPVGMRAGYINWSPDLRELSMGAHDNAGLWIYDMKEKEATKVLSGSFNLCSWAPPDISKIAIGRAFFGQHYEIWVADLDPNVPTAESLGPGRTVEQHCQEMADLYTRRIKFEPEEAGYYLWRARCHIHLQNPERASADIETCARLLTERDHPAAAVLTSLQENLDYVDTVFWVMLYQYGGIMEPENPLTFNGIAWLQATSPSADLRDGAKAVDNATKACELTKHRDHRCVDTLAAAHAETGGFDLAVKCQKKALDLLQEKIESLPEEQRSGWVATRAEYESRLELYKSGKPYRESSPEDQ